MLTLEELLKEREARLGKDHPAVQMLRNQIMAEQSGKNLRELYTTGSVSIPERFRTIDPNGVEAKIGQELCDSLNATVLERQKEGNKTKSEE
jgi:hypothetical protein